MAEKLEHNQYLKRTEVKTILFSMADEWEDIVIETGVDTLLNYLVENQKAPVSEISDELGVSEDRIKTWAKALKEEGLIEKKYSTTKGMILLYTSKNKEEAEKRLAELREQVDQETEKVENELETRQSDIEEARENLKELSEELEENREKEEEVKDNLDELEQLEDEIEERLEKQREKEKRIQSEAVDLISRIDSKLNRIEEAEEKAERFEEERHTIKKKIKALEKLEKHSDKAEKFEDKLEDLEKEEQRAEKIFKSFKDRINSIFSSKQPDYEEILQGTVGEVKEEVRSIEDPDIKKLEELERQNKNRETLLQWLDSR